jgi:pimeloyl-ACP methyl ester carboxylesterase
MRCTTRWTLRLTALASLIVSTSALLGAPGAEAADRDGPPLSVSRTALADSLDCHGDLAGGSGAPVLLIPGTTLEPRANFDWNYEPALADRNRAYCTVRLPGKGMGDIQVAAEYVVHAIRAMHARADRRIDLIGFSQGGMIGRWAFKFWPDTRDDVDDYVSIDGSNHGTLDAHPLCAVGCAPSFWQQRSGSRFLTALNSGGETYAGISYTQVYTVTDEVVAPNLPPAASTELHTGQGRISNIAVQSICPVHVAEHLSMGSSDPVGWAVALDAITHDGPARAGRISRSVCGQALMPGVNPLTVPINETRLASEVATSIATSRQVPAEPPLADYASDRS